MKFSKQHKKRRQQLLEAIGDDGMVIVMSGEEKTRNADVHYPFRTHSDFYYLTGIAEAKAIAVISAKHYVLFVRQYNEKTALWDGETIGLDQAKSIYGADKAYDIERFAKTLPTLLANVKQLHYDLDERAANKMIRSAVESAQQTNRSLAQPPTSIHTLKPLLHPMRMIKDDEEIASMQQAINITISAHQQAMRSVKPNGYEYETAAILDYTFRQHNAHWAYPHIVAGGSNACTLHYIHNDAKLKSGDLLLIDAGAEYNYYAADITRTFPISGKFSSAQRQIYQLVLDAQKNAIAVIKPGNAVNQMHEAAVKTITDGLISLKLLSGSVKDNIKNHTYRQFFPHGTGHYLGLDVHDAGIYKHDSKGVLFTAGMVTTVEPGIYIRPDKNIAKKWWHIGVRIEDNVLVTAKGNRVLTAKLVKEVDDVEQLIRSGNKCRI